MGRRNKKLRFFMFLMFWILIIATFSGLIVLQAMSYNGYRRELDNVMAELAREKQIGENLLDQMAYYDSDAYIEQVAREQLGYVKSNEIIFINVSRNDATQ